MPTKKVKPIITEKYNLNKGDYNGMRAFMREVNWKNELLASDSVDQCWEKIETKIIEATNKFIPKKKFKENQVPRSFIAPDSLLTTIQLKRKFYKMYKTHPTSQNYTNYALLRNRVNDEVREAKKSRKVKLAKEAKSNPSPKALFKYISSKNKPQDPDPQKKR